MEYTIEDYNNDIKLSEYVFRKYFKKYIEDKEDLIQSSIIALWKKRNNFDISKGTLSSFKFGVSYYAMLEYFRSINKGYKKGFDTYTFVSMNNTIPGTEDLLLCDIIEDNSINLDKNLEFQNLIKVLKECSNQIKWSKNARYSKQIVEFINKGYCDIDISKKIGCTRELCRVVRKRYVLILRDKLKEYKYLA